MLDIGQPMGYHYLHKEPKGSPFPLPLPPRTTLHAYSDLLHDGGRLAATVWDTRDVAGAVAATLRYDDQAIVLRVNDANGYTVAIGHAPGGIAA